MCWGQCPAGTEECGAICLGPDQSCADYIQTAAEGTFDLALDIAEKDLIGAIINTVSLVDNSFDFPQCENW